MSKSPNTPTGASSEKLQETHRHEAKDRAFSDYVVYVDESGDHSLTSINPDFPIFCFGFLCVSQTPLQRNDNSRKRLT